MKGINTRQDDSKVEKVEHRQRPIHMLMNVAQSTRTAGRSLAKYSALSVTMSGFTLIDVNVVLQTWIS